MCADSPEPEPEPEPCDGYDWNMYPNRNLTFVQTDCPAMVAEAGCGATRFGVEVQLLCPESCLNCPGWLCTFMDMCGPEPEPEPEPAPEPEPEPAWVRFCSL